MGVQWAREDTDKGYISKTWKHEAPKLNSIIPNHCVMTEGASLMMIMMMMIR